MDNLPKSSPNITLQKYFQSFLIRRQIFNIFPEIDLTFDWRLWYTASSSGINNRRSFNDGEKGEMSGGDNEAIHHWMRDNDF